MSADTTTRLDLICFERPFDVGWLLVRVLGVDPGMTRCGIGVVDGAPGRPLTLVHVEVVHTAPGDDIGVRLLAQADAVTAAIAAFAPDVVAVERVFSQHNVRTVMGTAQVAGLAIVAATRAGIPIALHTPSEVKAAVTGSGTAGKAQVGAMVTRLLRLAELPRPADAADALALAICHVWRGGAQSRIAAALSQSGTARSTATRSTVARSAVARSTVVQSARMGR